MGAQAAKELRMKVQFEIELRPKIQGLFKAILRDFVRVLGTSRTVISAQDRAGVALEAILSKHYVKVTDTFSKQMRFRMPSDLAMTHEESAEIDAMLIEFISFKAPEQTAYILQTTQQNMFDAVVIARNEQERLSAKGRFMSEREVAVTAGRVLERRLNGRVSGIATYETQWPAEMAKALEVSVLIGEQDIFEFKAAKSTNIAGVKKQWASQTDSRVRDTHLMADGQNRKGPQPFNVGQALLLWPGDKSLGAPGSETNGCRCSAIYEVESVKQLRKRLRKDAEPGTTIRRRTAGDLDAAATESDLIVAGQVTPFKVTPPRPRPGGGGGAGGTSVPPPTPPPKPVIPKPVEKPVTVKPTPKPVPDEEVPDAEGVVTITNELIVKEEAEDAAHLARFTRKRGPDDVPTEFDDFSMLFDFESFSDILGPTLVRKHRITKDMNKTSREFHLKQKSVLDLEIKLLDDWFGDVNRRFKGNLFPNRQTGKLQISARMMKEMDDVVEAMLVFMQRHSFSDEIAEQIILNFGHMGIRAAHRRAKVLATFGDDATFKNVRWQRNALKPTLDEALTEARSELKELGMVLKEITYESDNMIEATRNQMLAHLQLKNSDNFVRPMPLASTQQLAPDFQLLFSSVGRSTEKYQNTVQDVVRSIADSGTGAGNLFVADEFRTISWSVAKAEDEFRAFASKADNAVHLDPSTARKEVIAHEFGHHIEFRNPEVKDRIQEWFDGRILDAKVKGESISQIYEPRPGHEPEMGWKDGFWDHYIGRDYGVDALGKTHWTEVMSMGLQALKYPPFFREAMYVDPEHMELMWSILRGY
jgi:hypothetical protein